DRLELHAELGEIVRPRGAAGRPERALDDLAARALRAHRRAREIAAVRAHELRERLARERLRALEELGLASRRTHGRWGSRGQRTKIIPCLRSSHAPWSQLAYARSNAVAARPRCWLGSSISRKKKTSVNAVSPMKWSIEGPPVGAQSPRSVSTGVVTARDV